MTILQRLTRNLTPSLVVSLLALLVAGSTGAYALALGNGDVKARHLAEGAVNSAKVKDFSLRLRDLGGRDHLQKQTIQGDITIPTDECRMVFLDLDNPAPPGVVGSLVVGYVTDADGDAVLDNAGAVVPTMISETSQGGAIANLVVCADSSQTIPAGSVFHYQLIGPGR